ncbi:MAG: helix-turn-helix domain-containing protein [Sphingomonadales bacterium]|nr:helix-turn-helix domain-containing protein [Sphingomonadales bacterium]
MASTSQNTKAANLDNGRLLVNIMEAASLLSCGRSTVYKLLQTGELKKVKLGCSARITMESIRAVACAPADQMHRAN